VRILSIHNHYQHAGGEDEVFRAEAALLRAAGHEVVEYTRTNDDIAPGGVVSRVRLAANTVWARGEALAMRRKIRETAPDVAHFHNTLPLISPAAYYACRGAGIPVVQTLHNYRLLCPAATQFRAGQVCEACNEVGLLSSVRHACYRGSRGATATVAAMLAVHRMLGTWRDQVDVYIALSEFARSKFVAGALPPHKVVVKPNFVHPDPGPREGSGELVLFVGRLSSEKGVRTMLDAWTRLRRSTPLEVLGDGPDRTEMTRLAAAAAGVRIRGRVPRAEVLAALKRAQFLVFPSECYEGLPMTVLEAFACGVPVIASRLGTLAELVADRRTGLHFTAGDAADLAAKVDWALSHPQEMAAMGREARREFEARYTAARNLQIVTLIYERAIASAGAVTRDKREGLPLQAISRDTAGPVHRVTS
jgi:glycosyltransferase involved in cell wall biosynthesis